MEILNRKALIIEIVMIICIFGVAVGFSSILVKPFNRVTQAITEVKDGFTDEPIAVPIISKRSTLSMPLTSC